MQLSGSASFASGIALIIDKSESLEDVSDQQEIFLDAEPGIWRKINKWVQVFNEDGNVCDRLDGLVLPEGFETNMSISFRDSRSIMSESEKLDNLKKRKELGIDTMVDLLMRDQPGLSKEDAENKLKTILEEKMSRMATAIVKTNEEESDESDGDETG
jgi:hypothetical protein